MPAEVAAKHSWRRDRTQQADSTSSNWEDGFASYFIEKTEMMRAESRTSPVQTAACLYLQLPRPAPLLSL